MPLHIEGKTPGKVSVKKKGATAVKASKKAAVVATQSKKDSRTGTYTREEQVHSMVEVPTSHANVGISASRTIPLGEYASVKVGVSLFFPCAPNKAAVESTYDYCYGWVDEKMKALTDDIEGGEETGGEGDGS